MSRRRKASLLDDLVELIAFLPWWGGVGLALVSYVVLHAIAAQTAIAVTQPGQMGQATGQAVWKGLASIGQFVLPIACLAAAAMSALGRAKRTQLVTNVAQSRAADALHEMSWAEFELLVGEAFRLQGYVVAETGGGGADGGVDLILRKDKEKFLVQCKQWKAFKVGVTVVRELYGVMASQGVAGGFVVTSGTFTDEASVFADGKNVKLLNGKALFGMIQAAKSSFGRNQSAVRTARPAQVAPQSVKVAAPLELPTCPVCAKEMTLKMAQRGPNAGNRFWSCVGYPGCKGARPIGV
ncbi:MAG: restriction endonuclease [Pseudomonadota bacterium]|nr:restriction endonuclease [Pseudomonadota bacterium]